MWLWKLMLDQFGQDNEPEETPETPEAPPEEKPEEPEETPEDKPDAEPEEEKPPQGKYGEFGDDPNALFEHYKRLKGDHDALSGKTTATEQNLAALRKTLRSAGIRYDEKSGQLSLIEKAKAEGERKTRFTDDHKKLFDTKVLEAINFLLQDTLDGRFSEYESSINQKRQAVVEKGEANSRMAELFPNLLANGRDGKPNPSFDTKFYDLATEIWEDKYKDHPKGELFASLEAAAELGISPTSIEKAKKAGYEKGKADKKVLGPVKDKAAGRKKLAGEMSFEEYSKLSPEDREKYDKQQVGVE